MTSLDPVAERIDKAYRDKPTVPPRTYIGASIIGHPCDAYLTFCLRGFPEDPFEPRIQRIFRDGHRTEDQVIADLKMAGYRVYERDPMTGRQWEYKAYGGHIAMHADGHIEDDATLRLLEIKSANANSFEKFNSLGVRVSHPRYYDQMQLEMGYSKIESCLFVMYCKDNSLYRSEVVPFNQERFEYLLARIDIALMNEARRVAKDESDWRCKGCSRLGVCWRGAAVPKLCRTCEHASPTPEGDWWCRKHGRKADEPCPTWKQYEPYPR